MNWQELANLVNARNDYQLLQIGWLDGWKHDAFMHYQRALIQRVVFHENLFSIYLAWEAFLDPFTNLWLFSNPPRQGGKESAQIIDSNVSNIQPLVLEMPYGKTIFRVRYRNHQGMLRTVEIDPSSIDLDQNPTGIPRITLQEDPFMNFFETGSWIIPHDCGPTIKPLHPSDIKKFIR